MQNQNDLALNLLNLFNSSSYKEFSEGFFVNKPKMKGYYYIFKKLNKPKFCLIVNTNSDFVYPSNMSKVNDYIFIVFSANSLEQFFSKSHEIFHAGLISSELKASSFDLQKVS